MATSDQYDRLSALDESFLHLERVETPMHVGAVAMLEREPFYDARGRFRLDEVQTMVASRLQLIPRFRKRVMSVPLGQGRPIWVDDEQFDISHHVRLSSLPAPGGRRQLLAAGGTAHGAAARPRPSALGAVVRRGCRPRASRRRDPQVAPHAHRRDLGHRHRHGALRLRRRSDRARPRRLGSGAASRARPPRARQRARSARSSG